jgi:hypothetical protein
MILSHINFKKISGISEICGRHQRKNANIRKSESAANRADGNWNGDLQKSVKYCDC